MTLTIAKPCELCDRKSKDYFIHCCKKVVCSDCIVENCVSYGREKCAFCNVILDCPDKAIISGIYNDGDYQQIELNLLRRILKVKSVQELNFNVNEYERKQQERGLPLISLSSLLNDILQGLVSGELAWEDYQDQPEKLLEVVNARRPLHYR